VIRLVTQFDPPSYRVAVATPTCGGCCCCCCCVVTFVGASALTARDAQRTLHRTKEARPEAARWRSPFPGLVAALALTLALAVGGLSENAGLLAILVALGAWFALVSAAYWGAGHPRPALRGVEVVVLGSVALVVEFFVWTVVLFGL
jgi:hypothetical protein